MGVEVFTAVPQVIKIRCLGTTWNIFVYSGRTLLKNLIITYFHRTFTFRQRENTPEPWSSWNRRPFSWKAEQCFDVTIPCEGNNTTHHFSFVARVHFRITVGGKAEKVCKRRKRTVYVVRRRLHISHSAIRSGVLYCFGFGPFAGMFTISGSPTKAG